MKEAKTTEPWYVTAYGEDYYEAYKDQYSAEETRAEVEGIIQRLELAPGARVLDVSCGFGRHSVELAKRGFRVTGLDLSPHLLRHAREAADRAGVQVTWITADMREIPVPEEPYQAVVSLFSSFGLLGTDQEELKVARAMAGALAPGGKALIETVNREIMLRRWMPMRWREQPDGAIVCDKLKFDAATGILHSEETAVLPNGQRTRSADQLRLWSFSELALLLRVSGFEAIVPFGDLDGSRYTWDSHRMVAVAGRAAA
jgi:ubiquinone/menaquinone biosynthesis C-methylase UbiE